MQIFRIVFCDSQIGSDQKNYFESGFEHVKILFLKRGSEMLNKNPLNKKNKNKSVI